MILRAVLIEHRPRRPHIWALEWLSSYRLLHEHEPPTKEDDLYALGVSIWELYTGKQPFQGLSTADAKLEIILGKTVDLSKMGDTEASGIVRELMAPMLMKILT